MNNKLIILILILSIPIINITIYEIQPKTINTRINKTSDFNLNLSQYTNLTGNRIIIDDRWDSVWPYNSYNYLGDPDNKTWSELALEEDWCSGSGTYADPYIIEAIFIDNQKLGTCLSIFHSNVFFVIRNCYFHDAGSSDQNSGISLHHVHNGKVESNIFTYNHHSLWIWRSFNTTITGNTMINDHTTSGYGKSIRMEESDNNTISKNRSINHYDGINIWDSKFNIITENFIENNLFGHFPDTGLYLINTNHCIITFNTFAGDYANFENPYGESIINEQNCVGNTIVNNFNENYSTGINIKNFINNLKLSNPDSWFTLSESNYNYVYGNRLYIPQEPTIIGYNLYVLISILGIVTLIHIIILKHRE
jgi:parallel beta-helix repeat protein